MISFASPELLPVGLITSLLLVLYYRHRHRRQQEALARFGTAVPVSRTPISAAHVKGTARRWLVPGGVFCCFLVLAGPQHGYRIAGPEHRGVDILFALDTSLSMFTPDTRPNRLTRSKLAIDDFVGRLNGVRVGLLPFAGSAHLLCPLTTDYRAFRQSLFAVDSDHFPAGGTDLGNVIETATALLQDTANSSFLVIISDGEELVGNGRTAAAGARRQGIIISTVGVGSDQGDLVLDPHTNAFIKDRNGQPVKSRLQRSTLAQIAEAGGGRYADLGIFGEGLSAVFQDSSGIYAAPEAGKTPTRVPQQRSEWPMAVALLLFCTDFLASGRNGGNFIRGLWHRFPLSRRFPLMLALVLQACFVTNNEASASKGEQLFAAGNYSAALAFYQERLRSLPDDPTLLYNTGTTLYRMQRYQEAIALFDRALLETADHELRQKLLYNRGNAWFRVGQEQPDRSFHLTIKAWEQALQSYAQTLSLAPDHSKALANHALVLKHLQQVRGQTGAYRHGWAPEDTPSAQPAPARQPLTRAEAVRILHTAAEEEGRIDPLLPRPAGREELSGEDR